MECDICMLEWNTDTRIPRLLQCGHTFCQTCLLSLLSSSQKKGTDFFCPNCMAKHKEIRNESAILSLIKNFHLLRIAEKIEIRKTIIKNSIDESKLDESMMSTISNRKKIKLHPYDNSDYKESNAGSLRNDEVNNSYFTNPNPKSNVLNTNDLKKDKPDKDDSKVFEKKLTLFKQIEVNDLNAKCKKHGQSFNSYVTGTNILFCNKCIEESNMEVCPLPTVIKEYKKKIDSSKLNICLISNEIRRLYDFFESYQEEFDKSNKQKIDDLFAYYYKIISFNYNTAIQIFSQCKGEQRTQIEHKINELKLLEEELYEFNEELTRINSIEDYKILKEDGKLEEIYERLNTFINYDSELSLLTMKVGVKTEFKNSIFNTIQESYYLDVEFASIQGETPTLKHILQKEKYWTCICGELNNPINQISCFSCDRFRRFETILNFYSSPNKVSTEDMKLFQVRRKAEGKIFQDLIKENEALKREGSLFYVIDLDWFLQWKCYVTNDSTDKNLPNSKKKFSINKEIGVLPPGPISNGNLFYKANQFEEKTLRKGLSKVRFIYISLYFLYIRTMNT